MRPKRKTSCSTRRTSDFHHDDGLGEDFDVNDVSGQNYSTPPGGMGVFENSFEF